MQKCLLHIPYRLWHTDKTQDMTYKSHHRSQHPVAQETANHGLKLRLKEILRTAIDY